MDRCLNCDADLRGAYCHHCGQRVGPARVGVFELVGNLVRETFALDGRLGRTVGPLFLRPGFLVAEYLRGRRVRYSSPVRLYLFALLVGFVVFRWVSGGAVIQTSERPPVTHGGAADAGAADAGTADAGTADAGAVNASSGPAEATTAPAAQSDASRTLNQTMDAWFGPTLEYLDTLPPEARRRLLNDKLFDAAPTVLTLLIPLFALFTKLLFPRRTYVEHLVFGVNLATIALLTLALAAASHVPVVGLFALAAIEAHLLFGLRRVFGAGWLRTLASTALLAVLHLALFAIGMLIAVALAIASI